MNKSNRKNKDASRTHRFRSALLDFVFYAIGSVLFAASVDLFTSPNNIAPGGVTGVSTMINHATGLPIGTLALVLNVPLFILAWIIISREYAVRSCIGLVMSSIAVDLLNPVLEPFLEKLPSSGNSQLLASIFGGVIMGIGLGLIFMRGSSTGGSDIVARIFHKFFPHVTQGNLILFIDAAVVLSACFVFDFESGLYSIITVFVCSYAIDRVLYGTDNGKLMYIMTAKVSEVNSAITVQLDRGTTLLKAKGGYSGAERDVIFCAVRRNEAFKIRSIVREVDPNAFIIIGDATEILGEGFKPISENEFGESE